MRKILTLVALAMVALVCDESHAAGRRVRVNSVPAGNNGVVVQNTQSDGPFARLMEMERRKNAALRQMFFGR
jgi:hypothetical protein